MEQTSPLGQTLSGIPVRTLKLAFRQLGLRGDFDRLFSPKTSAYGQPDYQSNLAAHLEASGIKAPELQAALDSVRAGVKAAPKAAPATPASPLPPAIASGPPIAPQTPDLAPASVVPLTSHSEIRIVARRKASEVFGFKGCDVPVDVWNDPLAPTVDSAYRMPVKQTLSALRTMNRGGNAWLAGKPGTGKTEFVRNLCGYLGRSYHRIRFDANVEAYDIVGGERIRSGSNYYHEGEVLRAMQRPGSVILLDEVSFGRPEYMAALHSVLEPTGEFPVAEIGRVYRKAPGVVFFAADNTNGRGDSSGLMLGTKEMNAAFMSRWNKVLVFDYLPKAEEVAIWVNRTGVSKPVAEMVYVFINLCRQKVQAADLDQPPGMREALSLLTELADGADPDDAFEECVLNKAAIDSAEVLRQQWAAACGQESGALKGLLVS